MNECGDLAARLSGLAELLFEHIDSELVGGHHDGRVGDLPDELGAEPSVEAKSSLLLVDESQRLPERPVLPTCLTHSRTRHL